MLNKKQIIKAEEEQFDNFIKEYTAWMIGGGIYSLAVFVLFMKLLWG